MVRLDRSENLMSIARFTLACGIDAGAFRSAKALGRRQEREPADVAEQ